VIPSSSTNLLNKYDVPELIQPAIKKLKGKFNKNQLKQPTQKPTQRQHLKK
jgi:hypothetical protein